MKYFIYFSANYKENNCYSIIEEELLDDLITVTDSIEMKVSIKCKLDDALFINVDTMNKFDLETEFLGLDKEDIGDVVYESLLRLSKYHTVILNFEILRGMN